MTPRQPHFCRDCGKEFAATGPRQLRCPDCDHEPLIGGTWKCITSDSIWFGWRYRLVDWRHKSIPHGAILWDQDTGKYMQVRRAGGKVLFEGCDAPQTTSPIPSGADLLDNHFCHHSKGPALKVRVF